MIPPAATDTAEHSQLTAVEYQQKSRKSADHHMIEPCRQNYSTFASRRTFADRILARIIVT